MLLVLAAIPLFGVAKKMVAQIGVRNQPKLKWESYTSKRGRYTILMPGKVISNSRKLPPPANKITVHWDMAAVGMEGYGVGYNRFPILLGGTAIPEKDRIEDACRAVGTVLSSKPITLGGHPGREIVHRVTQDGVQLIRRVRMFAIGQLYQVSWIGRSGGENNPNVDKFLDSFELQGVSNPSPGIAARGARPLPGRNPIRRPPFFRPAVPGKPGGGSATPKFGGRPGRPRKTPSTASPPGVPVTDDTPLEPGDAVQNKWGGAEMGGGNHSGDVAERAGENPLR